MSDAPALNGDLAKRAAMDTTTLDWAASPSGTVWRKRLHLVGGAESGQVTSVVRYERGARFPAHDHPEGEEILVLEGTFSDEHGDWPAGTHLLNPEGFRHAPFSREGCLLFVKLRQYSGEGRAHFATQTEGLDWEAAPWPGIEQKELYRDAGFPDVTRLERWRPGASPGERRFDGGAELFVIAGALVEAGGARHGAGSWLRLPPGGALDASSPDGAEVYLKEGAVAGLRSA